ncbi:MAG: hypothetical protein GYB68_19280 [Chloroflexi bacterium]|nr:hypothetical protein [Chloroflexota bacterium]
MDRNWSVFVHLEDSAGFLAGQRDVYPGVGLLATKDLSPGRAWTDEIVVRVAETAYAPEDLSVNVGLYDFATGERMTIADDGMNVASLGDVALLAHEGDVPNPVSVNFGRELELIGYQLSERQVRAGGALTAELFFEGQQVMERDYTVSVQVLDPSTTQIFAQRDSWPQDGSAPTSRWEPGQVVQDMADLNFSPDTPPGEYTLQVVVYWQDDDGGFPRLQRVLPDGQLVDDFVWLTRIRVLPSGQAENP